MDRDTSDLAVCKIRLRQTESITIASDELCRAKRRFPSSQALEHGVYFRSRATSLKHCLRNALAMVLVAALSVQLSTAQTLGVIEPKTPPEPRASAVEPQPAPPPDLAIPLPGIADQAEQLDRTLEKISRDLSLGEAPGKTLGRAAPPSAQSIAAQTALINERARLVGD